MSKFLKSIAIYYVTGYLIDALKAITFMFEAHFVRIRTQDYSKTHNIKCHYNFKTKISLITLLINQLKL